MEQIERQGKGYDKMVSWRIMLFPLDIKQRCLCNIFTCVGVDRYDRFLSLSRYSLLYTHVWINACVYNHNCEVLSTISCSLPRPRRGLRGIVFTRSVCLSVCLSVCVCVSVYLCVRPIFWYFISRLLAEISIWNLYRILIGLYSIH